MCIAILKTKDGKITDNELRNSFLNNNDGAGIAYTINNKLIIEKGIFNVDEFIKKVRKAGKICDGNMLIHCRIGTSGTMDSYNTHPFYIDDDTALIHNGILDVDVPKFSKENDTQIYIKTYLQHFMGKDLVTHIGLQKLIGSSIGHHNKFVILHKDNSYAIINEECGHWKDGVWFSNNSYEDRKIKLSTYINYDYFNNDDIDYEQDIFDDYLDSFTVDDFEMLGSNPLIDYDTLELIPDYCGDEYGVFTKLSEYPQLHKAYQNKYSELSLLR